MDHQLHLYWLKTVPEYRELIKRRVSEARKRQKELDTRFMKDLDKLGREVEGCG